MAFLWTTLCAVFMVTVVMSKPIHLSEGEDSSKSSESSESDSSEENITDAEAPQEPPQGPAYTETDMPDNVDETERPSTAAPLPSAYTGPSLVTLDTLAQPDPEDPQTSTDTLHLIPDDPSQTALGFDISQDMPDSDPAQDSIHTDTEHILTDTEVSIPNGQTGSDVITGANGTNQLQVTTAATTTTYKGFHQSATPPFAPHIIKTSPPSSTASPLPIRIGTTLSGAPVSVTFQFTAPEPDPPRGDSI